MNDTIQYENMRVYSPEGIKAHSIVVITKSF